MTRIVFFAGPPVAGSNLRFALKPEGFGTFFESGDTILALALLGAGDTSVALFDMTLYKRGESELQ